MTAKFSRAIALIVGVPLLWSSIAAAQQDTSPTKPATPARPVVLPMTPGAELNPGAKPKAVKPRIVSATGDASVQPTRTATNATSDYTFCNRTSYAASVAVGIRNGGLWATRGWWVIPAGECRVIIKGALTQPQYFSFARSSFAHTGPIRTWGGTQTLCTGKGTFQATSDGSDQCGPGYEAQGFAKVDTNGKAAWTTTLSENANIKTLEQARVAGLQRLLSDLGRFEGAIDGVAGPKFNEALAQARTAFTVAPGDASGLYNKLLAEASKQQAGAGLTFCNRTQDIIWSAMGLDSGGKKISRGWWRLQPGQCEKVIKDRLTDQFVYAFAAADKTEGVAETWGGTKQFCTRDSSFEISDAKDCTGSGFQNTGFLAIDTQGRPGITFEFAARAEAPPPAEEPPAP